jgi:hypothetical protein
LQQLNVLHNWFYIEQENNRVVWLVQKMVF